MLNAHTKMYAHISQINVGHDMINTGHAKTDTNVLKNTRFYKLWHDIIYLTYSGFKFNIRRY